LFLQYRGIAMRVCCFAAGLMVLALAGCGSSALQSVKLAGTVHVDGKALNEGTLFFMPDKDGTSMIAVPIVDGKYTAYAVPIGTYKAKFSSLSGGRITADGGQVDSSSNAPTPPGGQAKKDPIPERYRQPSIPVDATVQNLNLNFDLKSK